MKEIKIGQGSTRTKQDGTTWRVESANDRRDTPWLESMTKKHRKRECGGMVMIGYLTLTNVYNAYPRDN